MNKVVHTLLLGLLVVDAASAAGFAVTSSEIRSGSRIANEQVFSDFGCQGGNVSPALQWKDAPAATKSFAITVYDPDAPTGSGWWHWVMFNVPANVTSIAKGAGDPSASLAPAGAVQSRTDFGKPGYGGPCPPPGDKPHHYQITVYALKIDTLPLDENAPAAMVGYYLNQNLIQKAVLSAQYGR